MKSVTTGSSRGHLSRGITLVVAVVCCAALGGCAGSSLPSLPKMKDLNPFAEPEQRLAGKRVPVVPATTGSTNRELAPADKPIALAAAAPNTDWSQPRGSASNAPGHLVFNGAGRRAWRVSVGIGSTRKGKVTASPIVYGGRIFTMDSQSLVTASSANGGGRVWRVQVAPEQEGRGEGYGGGLAIDEGRLIVSTGFGLVAALDPARGKKLWETKLGVPVRAAPTAIGGQVYVIASDGRVFSLSAADGSQLWTFQGLPQSTSLIASPSPAVFGNIVAVPYPSGDLVALKTDDGSPVWSDSLASTRTSGLGNMSDAASPAISDGIVYAIGHSGRMIAADAQSGERLWSLNIPGIQAPAVSNRTVFVVDTQGQAAAIDGRAGQMIWTVKLPGAKTWSGPTLASGRLWFVSNTGALVGVDAATGRVATKAQVGSPAYVAPVVAGGQLFVLTDKAELVAFR
ncbi:MAG: PQQ-binding-like beta-propeller repeat protein [Pseudomonadota bacterium]